MVYILVEIAVAKAKAAEVQAAGVLIFFTANIFVLNIRSISHNLTFLLQINVSRHIDPAIIRSMWI